MTSTVGGRMDVANNDVKLGRNGDQTVITEKQSSRKRSCIQLQNTLMLIY